MTVDSIFVVVLIMTTFLASISTGLLFAFDVVVMPGIAALDDREFIRAFQEIDGVIQNGQPLFLLVWIGSVLGLLVSVALGLGQLNGVDRLLMVVASLAYVVGVQIPTIRINVPLNNQLQALNVEAISDLERKSSREAFETRWNQSNSIRTVMASLTSVLFIILAVRL